MSTKESDLVTAAFIYVSRSIAEGDLDALRRMRLGFDDIQLFTQLRLDDMQRLALSKPHSHFLDLSWKLRDLHRIVDYIVTLRNDAEAKLALIKAEAPREMMAHLFGMSNNEYAGYLVMLDMHYRGGRPTKLSDEDHHRVWHAWCQVTGEKSFDDIHSGHYLALHRETNFPLRAIWPLAKRWSVCGEPTASSKQNRKANQGEAKPPKRRKVARKMAGKIP